MFRASCVPSSLYSLTRMQEELILGVPIGKERLFEVDVRTLRVRGPDLCSLTMPKWNSRCTQYIGRSPALRFLS